MEQNPFAALAALAVEILHDESTQESLRVGMRREDPGEFEPLFRQREEQARQLADCCLLAGDRTGFTLDVVEERVAAVVAAIRTVMCRRLPNRSAVGVTAEMTDAIALAIQGLRSLAARWAGVQEPISDSGPAPRRGRKTDHAQVAREREIVEAWHQARSAGVLKADFARDRGMKLRELQAILDRHRMRKK